VRGAAAYVYVCGQDYRKGSNTCSSDAGWPCAGTLCVQAAEDCCGMLELAAELTTCTPAVPLLALVQTPPEEAQGGAAAGQGGCRGRSKAGCRGCSGC
jgi:hypothetical protein